MAIKIKRIISAQKIIERNNGRAGVDYYGTDGIKGFNRRGLSPMMVAEYQLQLQDKKVLQDKLQELINMPLLEDDE